MQNIVVAPKIKARRLCLYSFIKKLQKKFHDKTKLQKTPKDVKNKIRKLESLFRLATLDGTGAGLTILVMLLTSYVRKLCKYYYYELEDFMGG